MGAKRQPSWEARVRFTGVRGGGQLGGGLKAAAAAPDVVCYGVRYWWQMVSVGRRDAVPLRGTGLLRRWSGVWAGRLPHARPSGVRRLK